MFATGGRIEPIAERTIAIAGKIGLKIKVTTAINAKIDMIDGRSITSAVEMEKPRARSFTVTRVKQATMPLVTTSTEGNAPNLDIVTDIATAAGTKAGRNTIVSEQTRIAHEINTAAGTGIGMIKIEKVTSGPITGEAAKADEQTDNEKTRLGIMHLPRLRLADAAPGGQQHHGL